jgi:heme/copper-type cytochrome/quinol oxidase subunit 3
MSGGPAGPTDGPGIVDRRKPPVPHGVFGMLLFVIAEGMLFAGLISAFAIIRASAIVWPPPDQPRLPVEATAVTTLALLASGAFLFFAHRAFHRGDRETMLRPMYWALALGSFFVVFQGFEWIRLIAQGFTMTSSSLGGFFYLIVGIHGLHALGAIWLLAHATARLRGGYLTPSLFGAAEVFWYFVVGVWPILYAVVYW